MLPLADEEAKAFLVGVPEERRGECWWLVLEDGTLVPGDGGGAVAVLIRLRTTRAVGLLLRTLRLGRAFDAFERLVARHRGRLGRFVPEGPALRRYP